MLLYRLAVMAGEADTDALAKRITWAQLIEWEAYAQIEPFGAIRDNYHAGVVAKMIANVHKARSASGHEFTYEDFLLKFDTPESQAAPRKQTEEEKRMWLLIIAQAVAGMEKT